MNLLHIICCVVDYAIPAWKIIDHKKRERDGEFVKRKMLFVFALTCRMKINQIN